MSIQNRWVDSVINGGQGSHLYGFPSLQETLSILDIYTNKNKEISSKVLVGVSFECRPIYGYWISHSERDSKGIQKALLDSIKSEEQLFIENCDNIAEVLQSLDDELPSNISDLAASPEGKLLCTSLHHAREPLSLTTPFYAHIHLLENEVEYAPLLETKEWMWLPFVNPDGYEAVRTSGNELIRKNRRITCNKQNRKLLIDALMRVFGNKSINIHERNKLSERDGVDINRNYGFKFSVEHNR